jgi:cell fate regulator YaaT (PSP1 superfamily)
MMEDTERPALQPSSSVFGETRAWGGKRRLVNAVDVRLGGVSGMAVFDAGDLNVRPGDLLVVDTRRGIATGTATSHPRRALMLNDEVLPILRVAGEKDREALRLATELEKEASRRCLVHVHRLNMNMKLVQVHASLDRGKLTFYFSSEDRVDFRTLVRLLSSELRQRIEMRQIGVREGAGVIGGIGPCGGELCCSMFLKDFASISIRFAKDQGLSLNPGKITGMCGRLKCCLVYEHPVYKELKRFVPKPKLGVMTPIGSGNISEVNILARKVQVYLHGGTLETFHMRDVIVLDRRLTYDEMSTTQSREEQILQQRRARRGGSSMLGNERSERGPSDTAARRPGGRGPDSAPSEEYLWVDAEKPVIDGTTSAGQDAAKKKRRKKKRRPDGSVIEGAVNTSPMDSDASEAPDSDSDGQGGPTSDAARKRKRRRKPGGPRPEGDAQNAASAGAPADGSRPSSMRPPREGVAGGPDRPPRADFGPRPPREPGVAGGPDRPPREGGGDRPPRADFSPRPSGDGAGGGAGEGGAEGGEAARRRRRRRRPGGGGSGSPGGGGPSSGGPSGGPSGGSSGGSSGGGGGGGDA